MAWRDHLIPAAFRGARFHVARHESQGGRRVHVHEYPGRDEPYPEDLGRRAREFEVEGYVVGDDYFAARDALLDACDAAGPGQLDHPYLGRRRVACTGCTVAESTREGRMARIAMTFVEAGENRYPASGADTPAAVNAQAERADALMIQRFREEFAV